MIWYRSILTDNELQKGKGNQFEKDFIKLFTMLKQPAKMALYKSCLTVNRNINYYLSMSSSFIFDLGSMFSQYRIIRTNEPDTNSITLLIGNLEASLVS